jgi:hypothetical protein
MLHWPPWFQKGVFRFGSIEFLAYQVCREELQGQLAMGLAP